MTNREHVPHHLRRTAITTVALVACLVFGITVLANSDWIPGGIIVAATTVALARQIPIIRKLREAGSATPPTSRPVS